MRGMRDRRKIFAAALLALMVLAGTAAAAEAESIPSEGMNQTEGMETAGEMNPEAGANLADGTYLAEVTLSGGSGRASVESPALLTVEDGDITATIVFGSPNYDYMIIGEERVEPVGTEGNSTFEIPVAALDTSLEVIADTTAMSEPHEIAYTLYFDSSTLSSTDETTDEMSNVSSEELTDASSDGSAAGARIFASGEPWCGLIWERSLDLLYAEQFAVDYYEGGYARIVIGGADVYLVVPEGAEVPSELEEDVILLQQPLQNIYLVATSAMDFFATLDALDAIRLSGTDADGWTIEEAKAAMEEGRILYAGKYSAPDYERILSEGCQLAIESTMIYHNPEVKEKLEDFGIPVLVERSSYENHPMGRTEWMKLYAVLLGCEEKAEEIFEEQAAKVQELTAQEPLGKTVAFFSITSSGTASVHRPGDYLTKMIELAGGTYVFSDLGGDDSASSTISLTMEAFYAQAKDADVIIYNSTIDGELYTISDLFAKSELFADFRAVQEGNVWCTGKNLFQETTSLGDVIAQIHEILTGEADGEELTSLHRLMDDRIK